MKEYNPRHVFISYVRENQTEIDRLCAELKKHGVKVWLDRNDIKPGVRWKQAIRGAISQGNFFIACFSKEYTSKEKTYMNEELVLAIEELRKFSTSRIWFIPILLSECDIPARSIGAGETLLDIQWVPLYDDWQNGIKRILEIIKPMPEDVQNLLYAMRSKNKDVRLRAIKALGNEGNASAVPTLINELKTKDHEIYYCAVEAIGKIGDKSAIPALIRELRNKDSKVRNRVADALGQIGPAAWSRLLDELKEKTPGIGQRACQALIRISEKSTIPALIKELKNKDDDIRKLAVYVLAEIGNDSAVPALNDALRDENPDVRYGVAYALSKIGNTSSLPALNEALKDIDQIFVDRVAGVITRINREKNLFKLDYRKINE